MEGEVSSDTLYNKESTIAQPISQLMKLEVFIRLTNVMTSLQILLKTNKQSGNYARAISECGASISILYFYLKPTMKKLKEGAEAIEKIDDKLKAETKESFKEIVDILNDYMTNKLKLTQIATRTPHARTDIIGKNKDKLGY